MIVGLITVLTNKRHKAVNSGQILLEGGNSHTKHKVWWRAPVRRDWQCCNTKPKEADTDAMNDATYCEKAGNPLFVGIPAGGALRNVMRSHLFFCINKEYYIIYCLKSCFAAITYQIKHYFDFSNCKFKRSFLISAIWRGSPCRRSSDDANTDWVHCLSPRCTVKWQTVLPTIWSQRRRDVGCATATVATDANVVTMSPDVALLAGINNLWEL